MCQFVIQTNTIPNIIGNIFTKLDISEQIFQQARQDANIGKPRRLNTLRGFGPKLSEGKVPPKNLQVILSAVIMSDRHLDFKKAKLILKNCTCIQTVPVQCKCK